MNKSPEIKNKRATFEYELLEIYSAGMMLKGTEVKALREGKGSLAEAYCVFFNEELWIRNMNIPEYSHGTFSNHMPVANRKLLLNKREIDKLQSKVKERGLSIIPVRIFFNERGFAKIEVALARGKKAFDKRESLKSKDSKREIDRVMKKYK